MNEQLAEYVKICKEKGQSDEEIKKALLVTGWRVEQFEGIFKAKVEESKNESIWTILKESWVVLGQDWKRMLFAYAYPSIILLLVVAVEIVLVMIVWKMISISFSLFLAILLLLIGLIALLTITWFSTWGGLCLMLVGNPNLRSLSAKEIRAKAKKFVWKNLALVSLLTVLIIGNISWLVIPGFVASLYFSMAVLVQVNEQVGSGEAIKRSREMIRGRVWTFIGNLLALAGIWILVNLIFGIVFSIFGISKSMQENISALLGFVLSLWSSIVMQRIYYKFKSLRGNYEVPKKYSLLYYSGILGFVLMIALTIFGSFILPSYLVNNGVIPETIPAPAQK